MKVIRFDHDFSTTRNEYDTDLTDIREIAHEFGRTEDTLQLYDNSGEMVAVATWPMGSKAYMYCCGNDLSPVKETCRYRY